MIMTYLGAALKAVGAAGLVTKVLIALGAAAAVAAAYAAWHHEVYQSGVNDTIAKIAKADARMIERATRARSALKDCEALGKDWDMSTGRCK